MESVFKERAGGGRLPWGPEMSMPSGLRWSVQEREKDWMWQKLLCKYMTTSGKYIPWITLIYIHRPNTNWIAMGGHMRMWISGFYWSENGNMAESVLDSQAVQHIKVRSMKCTRITSDTVFHRPLTRTNSDWWYEIFMHVRSRMQTGSFATQNLKAIVEDLFSVQPKFTCLKAQSACCHVN